MRARRYVIAAEGLFALAYVLWAVLRAYQPDIFGTEKFMDFGFMNAILKSPTFPPNDMWLSGNSINYYYFGYVLMAALTGLSGVSSQVDPTANVTLFALTALGAFGLVYNLIAAQLQREGSAPCRRRPGFQGGHAREAASANRGSSATCPRSRSEKRARPLPLPGPGGWTVLDPEEEIGRNGHIAGGASDGAVAKAAIQAQPYEPAGFES